MNVEDKIRTIFALPFGLVLGVVSSGVATLASLTHWIVLPVFALIVVAFIVFERVSDAVTLRAMEKLSDLPDEKIQELKSKKLVGRHSRLPLYMFLVGTFLGYVSTFIWSPTEILSWIA
ncbi:MAG: hypothetical protein AAF871_02940 [Pseudomonadota bacterium]